MQSQIFQEGIPTKYGWRKHITRYQYFSNLFLEYNISNELANYMLLALDTTARKHYDFMNLSYPDGSFKRKLDKLEAELQMVIKKNDLSNLLDLYYLVADR